MADSSSPGSSNLSSPRSPRSPITSPRGEEWIEQRGKSGIVYFNTKTKEVSFTKPEVKQQKWSVGISPANTPKLARKLTSTRIGESRLHRSSSSELHSSAGSPAVPKRSGSSLAQHLTSGSGLAAHQSSSSDLSSQKMNLILSPRNEEYYEDEEATTAATASGGSLRHLKESGRRGSGVLEATSSGSLGRSGATRRVGRAGARRLVRTGSEAGEDAEVAVEAAAAAAVATAASAAAIAVSGAARPSAGSLSRTKASGVNFRDSLNVEILSPRQDEGTSSPRLVRKRKITYLRTTAMVTPILKILSSGQFKITVPSFHKLMGDDEATYTVKVSSTDEDVLGLAGGSWTVQHRFNAFVNLHQAIKSRRILSVMPKFPKKSLFGSNSKRRVRLEEYLNEIHNSLAGTLELFLGFLRPDRVAAYDEPLEAHESGREQRSRREARMSGAAWSSDEDGDEPLRMASGRRKVSLGTPTATSSSTSLRSPSTIDEEADERATPSPTRSDDQQGRSANDTSVATHDAAQHVSPQIPVAIAAAAAAAAAASSGRLSVPPTHELQSNTSSPSGSSRASSTPVTTPINNGAAPPPPTNAQLSPIPSMPLPQPSVFQQPMSKNIGNRGSKALRGPKPDLPAKVCERCKQNPIAAVVKLKAREALLCKSCALELKSRAEAKASSRSNSSRSNPRATGSPVIPSRRFAPGNNSRPGSRRLSGTLSMDDFEMLKLLGVGGYGKVYLARKKSTGEILALKRMKKSIIKEKNQVDRVKTELEVLETIAAKQGAGGTGWLVRLFYSFQDPKYLCLAMEYVPGGDLRTLLDAFGVLEEDHARFYFVEMAMCIRSVHKLGYIHRDLKPDNFLIDSAGHLKLADFGLSTVYGGGPTLDPRKSVAFQKMTRRMKAYSVVGTPQYMAKDVLTGEGYDETVDWWAAGCILYEMISGEPPFSGESPEEIFRKIQQFQTALEFPPDDDEATLSASARSVVLKLICETDQRLGDAGFAELQSMSWFEGIDWSKLRARESPFVPHLENETDTSYFDGAIDRGDEAERNDSLELDAPL